MRTTAFLFGARGLVVLGVASALALAGCGGSGSNPPLCSPPNSGQTVLVYPAPNSTGIPDALPEIIVASTVALTSSFDIDVENDTLQATEPNYESVVPWPSSSPLPTPNATPSFLNPIYQQSQAQAGETLVAGSQITVFLNNVASNCNPSPLGSFTVQ